MSTPSSCATQCINVFICTAFEIWKLLYKAIIKKKRFDPVNVIKSLTNGEQ